MTIEIIGKVLTYRRVIGGIFLVCNSTLKGHCGYLHLIYQKMCMYYVQEDYKYFKCKFKRALENYHL